MRNCLNIFHKVIIERVFLFSYPQDFIVPKFVQFRTQWVTINNCCLDLEHMNGREINCAAGA